MFHDHVENVVDGLFKPKQNPLIKNPTNQGHVAMNDLHSKYPNIVQNDINIAHQAVTIACVQTLRTQTIHLQQAYAVKPVTIYLTKYLNDSGI